MGILLFIVGMFLVFLLFPALLAWAFCSVVRVRNPALRLVVFCLIAYLVWDHFQLPRDQTGMGYDWGHPAMSAGQAGSR